MILMADTVSLYFIFILQVWLLLVLVTTCYVYGIGTMQSILTMFRLSGKASSLKLLLSVMLICLL